VMNEGRLVHQSAVDELATQGGPGDPGDSPAERGYSALLRRHRSEAAR
jgi:ABC-2 type transport system ATP-binding protein